MFIRLFKEAKGAQKKKGGSFVGDLINGISANYAAVGTVDIIVKAIDVQASAVIGGNTIPFTFTVNEGADVQAIVGTVITVIDKQIASQQKAKVKRKPSGTVSKTKGKATGKSKAQPADDARNSMVKAIAEAVSNSSKGLLKADDLEKKYMDIIGNVNTNILMMSLKKIKGMADKGTDATAIETQIKEAVNIA